MVNAQQIAQVLGGREALGRPIRSMTDLDELVTEGIPRPALDALVMHLASPEDEREQLSVLQDHPARYLPALASPQPPVQRDDRALGAALCDGACDLARRTGHPPVPDDPTS
jgi:hypothetical protein